MRTIRAFVASTVIVSGLCLGAGAAVAGASRVTLDAQSKALVEDMRHSMNTVKSLDADFLQVTSAGGYARGKLYIQRPGKMRFDYDPPAPFLMISNGTFFAYYDLELEQISYALLSSTPAALLVGEHISFDDDVTIVGLDHDKGVARLELIRDDEPEGGSLTLVFSTAPMALRQWSVTDAQGVVITVTLMNPRYGVELDRTLFFLDDIETVKAARKTRQ